MSDLVNAFNLESSALGHLTSAVQFGFIFGTLVFAIFTIADRFATSKVFFVSALLGAAFNLGTTLDNNTFTSLIFFRFMTGFFLAGIYPVGMKIAADYFQKGLGKSLGFLVGALVLGTAFPHLLKGIGAELPWKMILFITSGLATLGGLLMLILVPNGPFRTQSDWRIYFSKFWNEKNSIFCIIDVVHFMSFVSINFLFFFENIFDWLSRSLGISCHRRLTFVLDFGGTKCNCGIEGNCIDDCKLHRFFYYDF